MEGVLLFAQLFVIKWAIIFLILMKWVKLRLLHSVLFEKQKKPIAREIDRVEQ
jgi:hypothetical protein